MRVAIVGAFALVAALVICVGLWAELSRFEREVKDVQTSVQIAANWMRTELDWLHQRVNARTEEWEAEYPPGLLKFLRKEGRVGMKDLVEDPKLRQRSEASAPLATVGAGFTYEGIGR